MLLFLAAVWFSVAFGVETVYADSADPVVDHPSVKMTQNRLLSYSF